MALKHIGQGSHDAYMMQPPKSGDAIFLLALRRATISAWAVGSLSSMTRLKAAPITVPSATMTAPNGRPFRLPA